MESLIDMQHVSVRFGEFEVLKDVSISFPTGETTFIIGPTGCGKSTLLKVAAGIIPADQGDVLVGNKSWTRMTDREIREFRLYASYVFQDSALWENMSIWQNLMLPLSYHFPRISAESARKKINAVLQRVGYKESTSLRPAELSAGEQKLVSFARALVLDPLLLFLDAPLSLVDGSNANRLVDLCTEYRRIGRSMIVVTNKIEFCFNLADRVCILEQGRLTDSGPLLEVVERWPDFMGRLNRSQQDILEKRRSEPPRGVFS